MMRRTIIIVLLALTCGSCFRSRSVQRSYYVLHGVTAQKQNAPMISGLVRVRNLDSAAVYEKFQIVVRRSPFELRYADSNVWAVKPNRMVSDVIARTLHDSKTFMSVTRELGEIRPEYIVGGDLHAIEVYDSGDKWFANLSMSLSLSRFEDGETLVTYEFEERKPIPNQTFSQGARALSELLSAAMDGLVNAIAQSPLGNEARTTPEISTPRPRGPVATDEDPTVLINPADQDPKGKEPEDDGTIFVPEK